MKNSKTRALHNRRTQGRIYGKKNPGICLECGEFVQHLYPLLDGSGKYVCYHCHKENK